MNKPITSRVQQAVNGSRGIQEPLLHVGVVAGNAAARKGTPLKKKVKSPLKAESAGDIVKKNSTEKTSSKPGLIAQGRASGGNSSLISGAREVAGKSNTIRRATDINAAASSAGSEKSGFTGSTSIGGAIRRNIAARIDKAGELNRARRDARRAGKSGASVNAAPSAEKVARDARVDAVIGGNSSSSALDFKPPSVDFSGMGVKAKGAAKPSAQDIRKEGRATRAQVRQDRLAKNQASRGEAKDARVASRKAGKDLKNADRIFGKNNVEVTAPKPKSKRQVKRDIKNTTLSTNSLLQGRSNSDSDTEANNFNPGFKNIKKSGVMSVPVDKVGPQKPASAPSVDASKLPNASSLGSSTGNYTDNRSNEGSGKTTRDNRGVGDFYNTQEAFKQGSVDKEKLTLGSESAESAVKMRMNSNVGIKSKSPMKKGYFKGM